jgi:hypothetical protein
MAILEEKAITKWCPHARVVFAKLGQGGARTESHPAGNRFKNMEDDAGAKVITDGDVLCKGRVCMMWEFIDGDENGDPRGDDLTGFCQLAPPAAVLRRT